MPIIKFKVEIDFNVDDIPPNLERQIQNSICSVLYNLGLHREEWFEDDGLIGDYSSIRVIKEL